MTEAACGDTADAASTTPADASRTAERCLLCGGSLEEPALQARDRMTQVQGFFAYATCSTCGSWQQTPLPEQAFLDWCYQKQNLSYHQPSKNDHASRWGKRLGSTLNLPVRLVEQIVRGGLACFSRIEALEDLAPSIRPPARLLDIGCAYGRHLVALRDRGYDVAGIELDADAARLAREQYGLQVRTTPIERCDFAPGSFDVVMMSHVLEHLLDPRSALERIARWLRPGGELLFKCPCADGIEFRRYGDLCGYIVHPPYHIFLPTQAGLRALLGPWFDTVKIVSQPKHTDLIQAALNKHTDGETLTAGERLCCLAEAPAGKPLKTLLRLGVRLYVHAGGRTSRIAARCVRGEGC